MTASDHETLNLCFSTESWLGGNVIAHAMANRLEQWRALRTPLRFLSAPGRLSVLMASPQCWLPIPRRNSALS
jgi:hypothetical protein